jgi:hypothetical protein
MMEHQAKELAEKLREIYPEISRHELELDLEYKPEQEYWIIKLEKGDFKLHTFLEKNDADACLEGVQCVYLGVQIGQFVENFKILEKRQ